MLAKIMKTGSKMSTHDMMEKANLLYTEERRIVYGLKFCYNHLIHKSSVSEVFKQYYTVRNIEHKELRNSNNLIIKYPKTCSGQKSFFYWCVKMWNSLPSEIQQSKGIVSFDKAIRSLILKKRREDFVYEKFKF